MHTQKSAVGGDWNVHERRKKYGSARTALGGSRPSPPMR